MALVQVLMTFTALYYRYALVSRLVACI